jgi:hypothetical protein
MRRSPEDRSVNWMWWLAIGFVVGVYFGIALTSLMQLSSRRKQSDIRWLALSANPLEGPSTITL